MVKLTVFGFIAAVVMGLGAAANGAVVFQDDFSDEAVSNRAWVESNDFITKKFENGRCIETNTDTGHIGYLYHELNNKPGTYTISTKMTRSAATALSGLAVGFDAKTNNSSIIFLLGENAVHFGKVGMQLNGIASPYVKATVNTLTVSIRDSVCNIFVNDAFVTTFKYTSTSGHDIACVVYPKTSATFDDFVMTDTFLEGGTPTRISDDFEDGLKPYWTIYPTAGPVSVDSGKLKMKTLNSSISYLNMSANVNLTDFNGKAAFSHRSGSTAAAYGLVLEGDSASDQATFAITAGQYFGAVSGKDTFTLKKSAKIGGKAYVSGTGAVTYYIDTLEIIKRAGSNEYIFVANRDTLTRLTGITFPITKVGLFCQDSLDLTVDDFTFQPISDPVSVRRPFITNRSSNKAFSTAYHGSFVFDPLGRSVIANRVIGRNVSSGVYFTKMQQKAQPAMIFKNQK